MANALETYNLTKIYQNDYADNEICIHVKEGTIYGLVGENGAGKTTLIRILLGLVSPSSGTYLLFGEKNQRCLQNRIGSLIEEPALYREMTARENLIYYCKAFGIDKGDIDRVVQLVGLQEYQSKRVRGYSLGMKQRLGIAIALLGNPELLILDEPMNGVDPEGIVALRNLFLALKEQGITIIISSHNILELYQIADNYGILHQAKLIEEVTKEHLDKACKDEIQIENYFLKRIGGEIFE